MSRRYRPCPKMKYLQCQKCNRMAIIHRKPGRDRRKGHYKHLWCPSCERKTKHKEIGGEFDVAEKRIERETGDIND